MGAVKSLAIKSITGFTTTTTIKQKLGSNLMSKLIIDPLPTDIYGPENSKLPAEAHLVFSHMPTTIFHIPKEGGIIIFTGYEEILKENMNGISDLINIIKLYCGDELLNPLDISKHPYFKTELFIFDRQYRGKGSYGFGVSNTKPIVNGDGEAHMYFFPCGPALCFNLYNVR